MINPQLSEQITNYGKALNSLSQGTSLLSLDEVLEILNARDKIQEILEKDSSITIEQQKQLIELDYRLKKQSKAIIINYDLSELRSSFSPSKNNWWWYLEQLDVNTNETISRYKKLLIQLADLLEKVKQRSLGQLPSQVILDILLVRDLLQQNLTEQSPTTKEMNRVRGLDRKFKTLLKTLPKNSNSSQRSSLLREWENWRDIYQPNNNHWWWFSNVPAHWWDRFDILWNLGALFLLALNLSLFLDILSRFLGSSSGLGWVGSFTLIVNSFLALLSGGILTDFGQSIMNRILNKRGIPEYFRQEFKVFIGGIILILFFLTYQILPQIANHYYYQGLYDYQNQKLDNAEAKYKRALSLYPDYPQAHYSLGVLYEDLQQKDQAEIQYNLAVQGGSSAASNNLARLYILSEDPKKYPVAASLLQKGIGFLINNPPLDGN